MGFLKEFKEFVMRGNIFDMSVGVIMGGAFGKIVTALTNSVIMPFITIFTGKANVSELFFTIGETQIPYGAFLQAIIDFLLTAAAIFAMVKIIANVGKKLREINKKEEEAVVEEEAPAPSEEILLLTEIRDLLKDK
ncbi:MAG: large conductance mechanosensitive channel protein MscL [Clostridia bacterium]|nr:large conductance mechanosensitive channel protein MscL [Clostridia bacterium]